MNESQEISSVAIFEKASLMLSEADTIQKTKELKSLFLTAADWAKRKGLGEEAIKYAKSYALEAERKMGVMLKETERAKGTVLSGKDKGGNYRRSHDETTETPTLSDLGLTKRESSNAQFLASIPEEKFEDIKNGMLLPINDAVKYASKIIEIEHF